MVRDELEAEDILQLSFVDVFKHLKSYKGQSTIGAWIKRIVINNCLNFIKKKKLMTVEMDDEHMQISEESNTEQDYPVSVKEIQAAMLELPEGYRVVLNLYLFEGYDHAEIGEILNITESTSKSQYSRAKKKLRELLTIKGQN
jgi:RNA polymerase sigma-70 factor (ECF subfamily)